MAKFALECPHCGTVNKASTFPFFAKKEITCANCKQTINVADNRMAVGQCSKCGTVAYDRAKGTCPVCRGEITANKKAASIEDLKSGDKMVEFICPQCGCYIQPVKTGGIHACPVCDRKFMDYEEIYKYMKRETLVSENGVSVIKYEGTNDVFVWKHPIEDFNFGSQLIVHESQDAIFCLGGQMLDTFGPGRYSLETENMPLLSKAYELPTGRQNAFHAEVYFINKTVQMGLKWGTDSRVNFIEPQTQLPIDIGASGEMNLQVVDSAKLFIKLVGTMSGISWDSQGSNFTKTLKNSFRPHILTTVKTHLASVIQQEEIDILNIDQHLEKLSEALGKKVSAGFEEFGLSVPHFYVSNIVLPGEGNPNYQNLQTILTLRRTTGDILLQKRVVDLTIAEREARMEEENTAIEIAKLKAEQARIQAQMEADVMITKDSAGIELQRRKGLSEAQIMQAKGYNEKDVLQAEVQKAYAQGLGQIGSNAGGGNGGGGGIMSDMLGLGIGLSAAQTMGGQVSEMMKGFTPGADTPKTTQSAQPAEDGWDCDCGNKGIVGNFCPNCGNKKQEAWECTCGKTVTGKFCSNCGAAQPEKWDCVCGKKGITGKFCSECGKARDAVKANTWDCECGNKGITGKFCSECGKKKEDNE